MKQILNFLNQYADDMDVMLAECQESLNRMIQHIEKFHDSTGFTLNYDKTKIYRVGHMKRANAKLYTKNDIQWSDNINVLGVEIVTDVDLQRSLNYEPVIKKCEDIITSWQNRTVSLLGKVNIVNTLIAPLFVYKMTVLPSMSDLIINKIHKMIEVFLWNGHKPKIPLAVLQNSKERGGLKLVNIKTKEQSLKTTWIKMIHEGQYPGEIVYNELCPEVKPKSMIWSCNLASSDVDICFDAKNVFWIDILKAWCDYHYDKTVTKNDQDHIIWYNSEIRVAGKPMVNKTATEKGLMYVSQLYEDGKFISDEEAYRRYGLSVMVMNQLKMAIPSDVKRKMGGNQQDPPFVDSKFAAFMSHEKAASFTYRELQPVSQKVMYIQAMWEEEFGQFDLFQCVENIPQITYVMKLRSFQYRLLMRAITTNIHLERWKIRDSSTCSFCDNDEKETIHHLFWDCDIVANLWRAMEMLMYEITGHTFSVSFEKVITNMVHVNPRHVANLICLATKQYIYRQRCLGKDLSRLELKRIIFEHKNIEKYHSIKANKMSVYYNRWYHS